MKKTSKWTHEYRREYGRNWMRRKRALEQKMNIFRKRHPESIISLEESELFDELDLKYIAKIHEKEKV